MSTEKPRFSITVDDELFKRLEDYRFENRCTNRSQAVVELIRQSLDEYDKNKRKKLKKLLCSSNLLNKKIRKNYFWHGQYLAMLFFIMVLTG